MRVRVRGERRVSVRRGVGRCTPIAEAHDMVGFPQCQRNERTFVYHFYVRSYVYECQSEHNLRLAGKGGISII